MCWDLRDVSGKGWMRWEKGGKDCSRIQRVVGDGVLSVMRLGYHNAELGTEELLRYNKNTEGGFILGD